MSLSEMGLLGCQGDASTSGGAFRLGMVERKINPKQAGQAGEAGKEEGE